MKKRLFYAFVFLSCIIVIVFTPSCAKKLDVKGMLSYQSVSRQDISLLLGDHTYPISLTLSDTSEDNVRDGLALITDGELKDVKFEMSQGNLKMLIGETEYMLSQGDCPSLYMLFCAFAFDEDDFVGATRENGSNVMKARFKNMEEFTLTLDAESFEIKSIDANCGDSPFVINFLTEIKED